MSEQRYSELKIDGQTYTEQWKIDEVLIKNKFNWMVNAEIKNARLEIFQDTLVWNGGTWYNGDWYFGVWRNGEWRYGNWQNGVWYNGSWINGAFNSGIIFNGKFHKGKILGGEIRGGFFFNVEISPAVVELTSDEYQAKKEEEQQTTVAQAQPAQEPGKVKYHSTEPSQQLVAQPDLQQEKFRYIKKFESFSNEELNEGVKDILSKVINYGKKGLLTAALLLSLAASQEAKASGKSDDIIKIGVQHIYKIENQNLNAALAAICARFYQICLNSDDEQSANNYKELMQYYLDLRDEIKPKKLNDKVLDCQRILLNSLDKFVDDKNKTSIMTLIDEGMNIDNVAYKFNSK